MTQLRIALCITDLAVGGAERCLVELATRLDRRRFCPVVYCLAPPPEQPDASCLPPLQAAGVEVHCLGARRRWEILRVLRSLSRLLTDQTVPPADAHALEEAKARLLGDRPLAARLGAANRKRAEQTFDLTRMVDAYQHLWESLADD